MDVSILIPLLNEEESLRELYRRIADTMAPLGREWEVVFVNDGSTDGSMDVLRELFEGNGNVKVLAFGRNLVSRLQPVGNDKAPTRCSSWSVTGIGSSPNTASCTRASVTVSSTFAETASSMRLSTAASPACTSG